MASSIAVLNATADTISYIAIPVDRTGSQVSVSLKHPTLEAYWTTTPDDTFNRIITQTTSSGTTYTLVARVTFGMGTLLSAARTHAPARIEQIEPAPVESDVIIDGSNAGIPNVDVFIFP